MQKIVRRAGLQPWPRLFHNLRASRETELVEKYPVQVVTGWLGNTPSVAMRHYLMTTQQHFDAALRDGEPLADHRDEKVAQKAAQQAHVVTRNEPQPASVAHEKTPVLPGFASGCDSTLPPGVERAKQPSKLPWRAGRDIASVAHRITQGDGCENRESGYGLPRVMRPVSHTQA